MKREILFRAKRKDGKGWIYGLPTYDFRYIFNDMQLDSVDNYEINPETLGQFIGLHYKKGDKIFEGDIFRHRHKTHLDFNVKYLVKYIGTKFVGVDEWDNAIGIDCRGIFKLGNIHDNPELLGNA